MSPVAKGPQVDARRAIAVAVAGLVAAVLLAIAVVFLSGRGGEVELKLGDEAFNVGNAEDAAETIAASRRPFAFPSLAGEDRPLLIHHLGEDPLTGWVAVIAVSPTKGSSCLIQWDLELQDFYEECDPAVRFPETGDGLAAVPVIITDSGQVVVDINGSSSEDQGE